MAEAQNFNKAIRVRVTGMLVVLSVQYLAGMIINLFGGNDPAKGPLFATIAFFTHIVLGFSILIGAIFILIFAYKSKVSRWINFACHGFYSVLLAIVAGIATLFLKGNATEITSFVMALSFLYAFAAYGYLFLILRGESQAKRTV